MKHENLKANGKTVKDLIEFLKQFDDNAEVVGEGVELEFWKFEYSESDRGKQLYLEF